MQLIESEQTGGAIVVPAEGLSLFRRRTFSVVVQRYADEVAAQSRLRELAVELDCRYSQIGGVFGVVMND